ncbi:hypothetical protein KUTeg_017700 [Tegillarca granosa]|uniref:Uncharacterized protein n=1 Tax=Tegillarca granosa TaxID=220873 RepID=A0ABQ9EFP0_TEGGR|nr:hypothetical protein KUTeg_017700 [Tegillarca granosa]
MKVTVLSNEDIVTDHQTIKGVKKKTLKTYKLVSPEEQGGLDDFKTKRAEFILESSFLDFMTDNLCLTNTSNQGMVNFKGHSKVKNRDLSKRFGGQYKGASSLQKNIVNKKQTLKHVERKTSRKVMYMSDQTANKSEKMIGEISANENSEKDSGVENETAATNQNQHMKHVAGNLQERPMSSPVPNRSEEKEGLRVHTFML